MTPTELLTAAAATRVFETKSPIAQASFDAAGAVAAVSTADAAFVLSVASGIRPRLGTKPRLGPFGACFHARAAQAVARAPADGSPSEPGSGSSRTKEETKNASWLVAARPGRRLWVAETWLDEDSAPVTRVAATLRPAVPPPSPAPGADATRDDAKPRKFEFGAIRPLGDVCALAVCDRALAVLDVPGGEMLDLFATGDPSAVDVASGARDVATSGAKAFVLAENPGAAAVWCLEAPASAVELARAVADSADADGGAEAATRALLAATRLRVAEADVLEDARARFAALTRGSAASAVKEAASGSSEATPESLRELARALEAYEAFVATVPADARPPPRRKPARRVRDGQTSLGAPSVVSRVGASERAAPERVVSRGAPAPLAAPAFAEASSLAPSASASEGSPADAYPPAASLTKFFFYDPRGGFARNAPDGDGGDATAETRAGAARRPAETAARRLSAKIVDDIALAPATEDEASDDESDFEPEMFEAETAFCAAKLEEDRADALTALEALEASATVAEDDASALDGAPFSSWSAYAPRDLADERASEDAANENAIDANVAAFAVMGLGSAAKTPRERRNGNEALDDSRDGVFASPTVRRRDARRRARRSRVDAAAAAAAELALARRSLDAGGLVPLLRRWRSARDDEYAEARRSDDGFEERFERSFTLPSRRDEDAIDGRREAEKARSVVSLARADAAARAVADADAALARVEARLEAAEKELGLFGESGGDAAAADPTVIAAAALARRDALFAEAERPSTGSPPASSSAASSDSEDAKTSGDPVENRTEALLSGGAAALRGLTVEAASEVTARAMRRALREVVSAAEEAARARAFAAKASAQSAEKDGAALARRAQARGEASRRALDAAASRASAAEAAGGLPSGGALACLHAAVEGDETLEALAAPSALASPGGAALAACVAEAALRLSDAPVARRARERAASRTLAPLEAHLAHPPPCALGRFPQLRALLKAERESARDPARDAALRALPFVCRKDARDGSERRATEATGRRRWRLAAHGADVAPFLEERGDWGARVAFASARCPRCALPLWVCGGTASDGPNPTTPTEAEARAAEESSRETSRETTREKAFTSSIAFPCGHAFHVRCVPENACVECLRLRGERLPSPAPAAHREGVAANAALEALFPST